MKKVFLVLSLFLLSFSCKLNFFEKVNIKSEPVIKVNLGTKTLKLDDYISAKSILNKIDDDEFKSR